MKKALLLILLAACSRSRQPPTCEQTCDRMLELAEVHLEQSIARMSDHADPETAANLRARAAEAREAERPRCLETCAAKEIDQACVAKAETMEEAEVCRLTVRP